MKTITLTNEEYTALQKILMETSAADLPLDPKERICQRRILHKYDAVKLPTVDIDAFPLTHGQLTAGIDKYIEYRCSQFPQENPQSSQKPIEESWNEFLLHYYPFKPEDLVDVTGAKLTPSYHGKECLGNGEFVGYECCCDECDHYILCFPDWRDYK